MEACCLCRRDVSAGTHKKKRKKLHGQSAAKARELLESVSRRERQVGLLEYDETRDKDAYVCHLCEALLCRAGRLKEELEGVNKQIVSYLSCWSVFPEDESVIGRKRGASETLSSPDIGTSSKTPRTSRDVSPDVEESTYTHCEESPPVEVS